MAFLNATDLPNLYAKAANMEPAELNTYLQRANAFALGEIGGIPPTIPGDDGENIKVAVALAFEIFAAGETGQVDTFTGNITDAAPGGNYARKTDRDPLDIARGILKPYKRAYEAASTAQTDRGVKFL